MKKEDAKHYDVFCGVDVGKSAHFMVAQDACGTTLAQGPIAQDEADIARALKEASRKGRTLVVVDQPGSFGSLLVAVALDMGLSVAHVPPKDFHDLARLYGEDKTDEIDAGVLASAALSFPRRVHLVARRRPVQDELRVLVSCREDAVAERTRCYNRLHDLLERVCPPLEDLFAQDALHTGFARALLCRYGGPAGLKRAGRGRVRAWAAGLKGQANRGPAKVEEAFGAIGRMAVEMPAARVIEAQVKRTAARAMELEADIARLETEIAEITAGMPETAILRSVPGIGPVYSAAIAAEIGDASAFPDAAHLAAHASLAPVKRQSGKSLDKSRKPKKGNRRLKNAFLGSAERAVGCDETSEAYYKKKRAEGKNHRQAIRALARQRVNVVYALLSNGSLYEPPTRAV